MEQAQQDAPEQETVYEPPQLMEAGGFAEVTLGSGMLVIEGFSVFGG